MNGSTLALVPSERHVEAALTGRGLATNAQTLGRWLRDAAESLAPELSVATAETTCLAAGLALDELALTGAIRAPDEPAARAALAAAFDRAIGSLRAAGTPADSVALASTTRVAEMGRVMVRVDEMLSDSKLLDPRGLGAFVGERLGRDPTKQLGPATSIEVRGFAELGSGVVSALEALHASLRACGGSGVRVELPRSRERKDDPIDPVADALERRWANLEDAPEIAWRDVPESPIPRVVSARDADGEARAAARAVLDAIAAGTPPERIAIAVPHLEPGALEPLCAALDQARVPFHEPRGRAAAVSPEGRATRALLAMAIGPIARDDVFEILRAPTMHAGVITDRTDERDAMTRAVALAHALRDVPVSIDPTGRWLLEGLGRAIEGDEGANRGRRRADAWMPQALARLFALPRFLADATSRGEVATRLASVLDRLSLGRPTARSLGGALLRDERREGALELSALAAAARSGRAIDRAISAFRDAAEALGVASAPVDLGRAAAEIELALRAATTAPSGTAPSAAAVRIARARDLTGLEHELVVVMGLAEGAFDEPEDHEVVDERMRKHLPAGSRPPSRNEVRAARAAELAWALGGASSLVFTHATGTDAEPAPPHRLVREAIARGAATRIEPLARVGTGASALDARSAELVALAHGAPAPPDLLPRTNAELARVRFFLDPRAAASAFTGRFALNDSRHAIACIGGASDSAPIAVTSIEQAATCPFLAFSRRVLRVRRRDELDEAADGRERGVLVHRALEAAFEAASRTTGDRDAILRAAREGAERALGGAGALAPLRRVAIDDAVGDALEVVAETLAAADPVRFAIAERRFGKGVAPPWQALELSGEPPVFVEGQIDRIDRSADGLRARVVDYKTGAHKPTMDDHGRTAFQLPLYAAVVARALGASAVEVEYVVVRPRGNVSRWPKRADARAALADLGTEAKARARLVVLRAWSGDGAPRPQRASTCARCDARDVCRRPAVAPEGDEGAP